MCSSFCCSFLLTFSCALLWVLYRLQSIQGSTGSGVGLSKGCSPFKAYTCSSMGTPWATVSLGICLLHHGAPPAPLTLLLPLFVTPLFPSPLWHFLPFLKYVFTEVSTTWLMGLAVSCSGSVAEIAGTSCVQQRAATHLFL